MKKIVLWLVALLFALTATATAQSKYEELELKGNVKMVSQKVITPDGILMEPIKVQIFSEKHQLTSTMVGYSVSPQNVYIFAFGDHEQAIALFHNDLKHLVSRYDYNLKDRTTTVHRDSKITLFGKLDNKGRVITAYTAVGKDGEELQMDNPKQAKQLVIQKFDDRGNKIFMDTQVVIEGTSKSITTIESAYNDKNQLTFEIRTRVDRENLIHHRKYLYNDKGFQTEIQGTDIIDGKSTDRGSFIHTHHKIDEQGNWLERSTKLNGVEVYRETRLFEYY